MELRINTTLQNGKYTIIQLIGSGGFGITYLARDNRLDRDVVIKEYFPRYMVKRDLGTSDEVMTLTSSYADEYHTGISKFLNEAKTLAQLNDIREIANVFDFFQENNTAYIVMEYIKGKNLKQIIKERTEPFTFDEAVRILRPCLVGLSKVHERGLIHRDFTPDNIIINEKGVPIIIDFGSSRDYVTNEATMTIMVKHGYAPVEQYSNGVKQGTYTDVYSASAILYEMLTLHKPDPSIERMISDPVIPPSQTNNTVTDVHDAIIMSGLAVMAENRFGTIDALLSAIDGTSTYNQASNTARVIGQTVEMQVQNVAQQQAGNTVSQPVSNVVQHQVNNTATEKVSYTYVGPQSSVTPAPAKKKSKGLIWAIIAAALVIIGIGVFIFTKSNRPGSGKAPEPDTVVDDDTNDNASSSQAAVPETGGDITVSIINRELTVDYLKLMDQDLNEKFTKANGYTAYFDYSDDVNKQVETVRLAIDAGVDYIVINPAGLDGYDECFREAKAAGIKIIVVDDLIGADSSLYTSVVTDYYSDSASLVEWLLKYLSDYDQIKVLLLAGTEDSYMETELTTPLYEADAQGKLTVVGGDYCDWEYDKAYDVVKLAISQRYDFNVVYTESEAMALAAADALDEAGITHGKNGTVTIVTFGGTKIGLAEVLNGSWDADVTESPYFASYVEKAIKNGSVSTEDKDVVLNATNITQQDIDKYGY